MACEKLFEKCDQVKGKRMSNIDNMRIVAVISTMLVYNQFIRNVSSSGIGVSPAVRIDMAESQRLEA